MKTLARTLCLFLIALPLGCDGGRSDERAMQRQLASGHEAEPGTGAAATREGTSEPGIVGGAESDSQRTPNAETAAPDEPDASPAAIALRDKLPRDLWIWPDARVAQPDLDADILDCSSRLLEDSELSARSDLAQLSWILDCMSGLGWARSPDFAPSRG